MERNVHSCMHTQTKHTHTNTERSSVKTKKKNPPQTLRLEYSSSVLHFQFCTIYTSLQNTRVRFSFPFTIQRSVSSIYSTLPLAFCKMKSNNAHAGLGLDVFRLSFSTTPSYSHSLAVPDTNFPPFLQSRLV